MFLLSFCPFIVNLESANKAALKTAIAHGIIQDKTATSCSLILNPGRPILFFLQCYRRNICYTMESCFRNPLFDLRGTRKVEIRHTNFHFSSKKVTSKSRKVEVFDLTIVKKLSTFRPKKAKVEKLKVEK